MIDSLEDVIRSTIYCFTIAFKNLAFFDSCNKIDKAGECLVIAVAIAGEYLKLFYRLYFYKLSILSS